MKRSLKIAVTVLLVFSVLIPVIYGFSFLNAIFQLQFGVPTLEVSRDGWTIHVTLKIPVTNPTSTPIPTLKVISEVKLNDNVLFASKHTNLGSLDGGASTVMSFTTSVDVGLLADLFWALADYLSGHPVSYYVHLSFGIHMIFDFTVYEFKREGVFELY